MENSGSRERDELMQINEDLLRSKGRLLQEIIELKKQVAANAKNAELAAQLQSQLNIANSEIVNHLLHTSAMSTELDEMKNKLTVVTHEKHALELEIEHMRQVKWYQRLLGKK